MKKLKKEKIENESPSLNNIQFGDRIKIDYKLIRKATSIRKNGSYQTTWNKAWVKKSIPETEVIVIGKRNLNNGYSEYAGDGISLYTPTEYFEVLLVVKDMRTNPFYY